MYLAHLIDNVNHSRYNDDEKEDKYMPTAATQIRIDAQVKKDANAIFSKLGLDMSGAVNLFLHQCVLRGGLPFSVELPGYNAETLEAMAEAKRISRDTSIPGYTTMQDLKSALLEEDEI